MNILIPYSWLKDYFKTNVSPEKVAEKLSLHSFSVEKIKKKKGDSVFEIEITPNRGDALSVLGIAREMQAIFPGSVKQKKILPQRTAKRDSLEVEIKNKELVPRFSAVVLDNVKIKESPKIIKERLLKAGIRPINNIVDITNYLMIERGQPMHAFDFDKIRNAKMAILESKKGEKIKTLDGAERILPQGVIIIKDGEGRIIDLCGIMGAENSEITKETKKVLLFVQIYDSLRIRRASMLLGHRTDAALRFEKGVDFEGVISSLWEAVSMARKTAEAEVSSPLIDIKNKQPKSREIAIDYNKISLIAGTSISKNKIDSILKKLGFKIKKGKTVCPSWRRGDIERVEDLAEEVIRIYGYYNLTPALFNGEIPGRRDERPFYFEDLAKDFLKQRGFYECYNYTLTSKENVKGNALEAVNPLTKDFAFLRNSLIPQLKEVALKSEEKIMVFEISNIFIPKKNSLPLQPLMLGLVAKNVEFLEFKGIIESLFEEMGIPENKINFNIKEIEKNLLASEISFEEMVSLASTTKKYTPISKFSPIKEDLTLIVPKGILYPEIKSAVLSSDKRIEKADFKYIYKNFITLSILYLDRKKQINSEDAGKIRGAIIKNLQKIGISIKTV